MRDGDESLRPLPSLTFQGRPSCSLAPSMPKSCTRGVDSQAGAGGNGGGAAVRVGMGNGRPLVTAGDASGLRHGSGSRSSGANSSGVLAKRADRVLVTRFAPRGGLSDLASFARGGGGASCRGARAHTVETQVRRARARWGSTFLKDRLKERRRPCVAASSCRGSAKSRSPVRERQMGHRQRSIPVAGDRSAGPARIAPQPVRQGRVCLEDLVDAVGLGPLLADVAASDGGHWRPAVADIHFAQWKPHA